MSNTLPEEGDMASREAEGPVRGRAESAPAHTPLVWPAEPTLGVLDVLSLMPWQTIAVARVLQRAGQPVPKKCEAEQAHALAFLLPFAIEHGLDWWPPARDALIAMDDRSDGSAATTAAPSGHERLNTNTGGSDA